MERKKKALDFVDSHRDEMLSLWKELVNTESGTHNKELVDELANKLKVILDKIGMTTKIIENKDAGNSIIAELRTDRSEKGIIFAGHMDTVYKKGTVKDNPFRIEGGKAYGPGVLDMKGGIVALLYVIKALNSIGYSKRPIKVIISGDEESGHCNSNGSELFIEESKGFAAGFNFETGFTDNSIIVGRKGVSQFVLEVNGISAHAGNSPEKGRSAIEEIAHKIIDIQNLTNLDEKTTFNVGTICGGTVSNAIPDYAKAEIDVRYTDVSRKLNIIKSLEEIAAKTYIKGTTSRIMVTSCMSPMETTDSVIKLFKLVQDTSLELGFGQTYPKTSGGGSDAANIIIAGVPALCGMGVKGGCNHTPREWATVESLFERSKLIIACVMNLDKDF